MTFLLCPSHPPQALNPRCIFLHKYPSIRHSLLPLHSFLTFPQQKIRPSKVLNPTQGKTLLQQIAMAFEGGDSKNISTVEDKGDDVQSGSNPALIVEPSKDRFVFLCYESPESWPSRVEDFEADLFPMLLLKAIVTRKADSEVKVSSILVFNFISKLCYSSFLFFFLLFNFIVVYIFWILYLVPCCLNLH